MWYLWLSLGACLGFCIACCLKVGASQERLHEAYMEGVNATKNAVIAGLEKEMKG